jgi:NitT/TauT family transport system substrate-binding protein
MRFRPARRLAVLGTAAAALAVAMAGCGGGSASSGQADTGLSGTGSSGTLSSGTLSSGNGPASATTSGLTHVNVGVLPIIDDAPVYVALQHGLFDAHGLDVTPVSLNSGEQATRELLSGQLQFTFSNYVTTILAASTGAQLRVVADGAQTLPNTNDLMVARDSPIKSVAQLRGKTIAVNAIGNVATMMTDATLRAYGVPADSVHYQVLPFPAMAAALAAHTVDAAWVSEPFITQAGEQTGAEELADTASGSMASFPIAGYATLRSFARANPAVVAEFTAALEQAEALSANRSVVEQTIPAYINGMKPAMVSAVQLDQYPTSLSEARLQRVADTMLSAGLLSKPFSVSQLLSS